MNQADTKRVSMILSILERGKSKAYIEMMKEQDIRMHLQSVGHGTAPSEMMDILGLGSNDKDVVVSFASEQSTGGVITEVTKNLEGSTRYGGLMMVIRISAINRLAAELLTRSQSENGKKEDMRIVESESKFSLILIAVNQGYSDEVMQTAKKAGATGGTVIRARLAGAEMLEQFEEVNLQEEKEIITILTPAATCGQIMQEVNKGFGLRTHAKGIVCAVPVEKALKI